MRLDNLIQRRFSELEAKAENILEKREYNTSRRTGEQYYNIPEPLFAGWITSVLNLLQRIFGEDSIHYKRFLESTDRKGYRGTVGQVVFEECHAIFQAAKEDYDGGYLFNVRALVKAEASDDALEQAEELLNAGYKDPACVVVGVALEITLKEMCTRSSIPHGKLDNMNVELRKAGVYNLAKQKQVTAWADLRNNAAHGHWGEYNEADVRNFIDEVRRFIADHL